MYEKIRPLLFKLDPESSHALCAFFLRQIAHLPFVQDMLVSQCVVSDERLSQHIDSLHFSNPIGLSAGFDKNANMIKGLSTLGFGFLEVGTITHTPQHGNPKPRLFRFVQEESLQNAMGFNNDGVARILKRLQKIYPFAIPIGVNVGKNKVITQSDSVKNYENAFKECIEVADYFVFNVSSPNTPNLRDLQNVEFIGNLFKMARDYTNKPLYVKISPDMPSDDMLEVIESAHKNGASGIIATNTSIDYTLLSNAKESGGISGMAITELCNNVFATIAKEFFGKMTLISSGGIHNADEAYARLRMGASLLQVYTGLIYRGPSFAKELNDGILSLMQQDGFSHISEVIGVDSTKKRARNTARTNATSSVVIDSTPTHTTIKRTPNTAKRTSTRRASTASTVSKATNSQTSTKRTTKVVRKPKVSRAKKPIDSKHTDNA